MRSRRNAGPPLAANDPPRWWARSALLATSLAIALVAGLPTAADASCSSLGRSTTVLGDTVGLLYDDALPGSVVQEAISSWSSCSNYASGFPGISNGEPGTLSVLVRYLPGAVGNGHCGSFSGRTITLFDHSRQPNGLVVACGSLGQNLAHELGHVFGLDDAPQSMRCSGHIMAGINALNSHSRRVRRSECSRVGSRWLTFAEAGTIVPQDELRVYLPGDKFLP